MRNVVMFWIVEVVAVAVVAAHLLCFGFVGGRPSQILKLTTSSLSNLLLSAFFVRSIALLLLL